MYRLTTDHFLCTKNVPVLMCDQAGPFDRNCELPFINGSAAAFVWRHLLKEQLPTDPGLSCDPGANLPTVCWQYLTYGTTREVFEFAQMYYRLKRKGIKIPDTG